MSERIKTMFGTEVRAPSDLFGTNVSVDGKIDANLLDLSLQGRISQEHAAALFRGEVKISEVPGLYKDLT